MKHEDKKPLWLAADAIEEAMKIPPFADVLQHLAVLAMMRALDSTDYEHAKRVASRYAVEQANIMVEFFPDIVQKYAPKNGP